MMSMHPSGSTRSDVARTQRSRQNACTHGARSGSGARSMYSRSAPPRKIARGRGGNATDTLADSTGVDVRFFQFRRPRRRPWGHGPTSQRHHPRRRRRPRARAFYEQLGWKLTFTDGDIVMFQAGPMVVSLWGRAQLAEDSGVDRAAGWGGFTLGYAVAGPAQVDAVCGRPPRPARPSPARRSRSRSATPASSPIPTATRGRSPTSRPHAPRRRNGGVAVMTWDELREYCLSLPGATETFPFEPACRSSRHRAGRCSPSRRLAEPRDVSVKCDPDDRRGAAGRVRAIVPGTT